MASSMLKYIARNL